jgi:thiamine-phosphate pyrophosphorylase
MDPGLISWGRAVKRGGLPPLWLFTDPARMADLPGLLNSLPAGLCGVVYRHDAAPDRLALGLEVARICRARRLALVVAGDARLAARLGAGFHLRGGRRSRLRRPARLQTASVHNLAELRRARLAGCEIVFISAVFATASHPGGRPLGPHGFRRLARQAAPAAAFALGGIKPSALLRLGKNITGMGGIDVFLPSASIT